MIEVKMNTIVRALEAHMEEEEEDPMGICESIYRRFSLNVVQFKIYEVTSDGEIEIEVKDVALWVNVYLVDRCFGGHEEGGWYYDKSILTKATLVMGWDDIRKVYADTVEEYRKKRDKVKYSVGLEFVKGESETRRRPRYC